MQSSDVLDRDDIIEMVRRGECLPGQAEAIAKENGWLPFAGEAPADQLHPSRDVYWSLPMAFAWYLYRHFEQVRQASVKFAEASTHWKSHRYLAPVAPIEYEADGRQKFELWHGHELAHYTPKTIERLSSERIRVPEAIERVGTSTNEFFAPLQQGNLAATGKTGFASQREPIPAHFWQDYGCGSPVNVYRNGNSEPAYFDVTVEQKQVRAIWKSVQSKSQKYSSAAETRAMNRLADLLRAEPLLIKAVALKTLKAEFPGLPERAFYYRIWPDAREAAGLLRRARAGRPRKSLR